MPPRAESLKMKILAALRAEPTIPRRRLANRLGTTEGTVSVTIAALRREGLLPAASGDKTRQAISRGGLDLQPRESGGGAPIPAPPPAPSQAKASTGNGARAPTATGAGAAGDASRPSRGGGTPAPITETAAPKVRPEITSPPAPAKTARQESPEAGDSGEAQGRCAPASPPFKARPRVAGTAIIEVELDGAALKKLETRAEAIRITPEEQAARYLRACLGIGR